MVLRIVISLAYGCEKCVRLFLDEAACGAHERQCKARIVTSEEERGAPPLQCYAAAIEVDTNVESIEEEKIAKEEMHKVREDVEVGSVAESHCTDSNESVDETDDVSTSKHSMRTLPQDVDSSEILTVSPQEALTTVIIPKTPTLLASSPNNPVNDATCFSRSSSNPKRSNASSNTSYKCKYCSRMFACRATMHKHSAKEHRALFGHRCTVCNVQFSSVRKGDRHNKESGHQGVFFTCSTCEERFTTHLDYS